MLELINLIMNYYEFLSWYSPPHKYVRIYSNRIVGELLQLVQMIFNIFEGVEVPPLTSHSLDAMCPRNASIAVQNQNRENSFQSHPGDDKLVDVLVLLKGGILQHCPFCSATLADHKKIQTSWSFCCSTAPLRPRFFFARRTRESLRMF